MSPPRIDRRRRLSLLATAGIVLGCEPTPRYATPEEPLVGTVEVEASATVMGASGELDFFYAEWLQEYRLRVSVPAEAYPKGTVVTVRLLSKLPTRADTEVALGTFLNSAGTRVLALQLLPASLPPAVPLHVALVGGIASWTFDVLHAREGDPAWTVVGSVEPSAADPTLSFDIDAPGLWSIGQLPLPPSLQGHLQRDQLACDDVPVTAPRPRTLDLFRDSYLWSSPTAAGCEPVSAGVFHAGYSPDCVVFDAISGNGGGLACFQSDAAGTGLTLHWLEYEGPSSDCPTNTSETEHYVLVSEAASDAGAPPADGGCPPDAGVGSDGGRG